MVATNYSWNPIFDCITEETNDAGVLSAEYTHQPKIYGRLISQHRNGTSSIYHFDAIGSARKLSDLSQAVTDEYSYSAFGETLAAVGSTANSFKFGGAGGYITRSSNNLYIRRRELSTLNARWRSIDPARILVANNEYAYCNNRPTYYVDNNGERYTIPDDTKHRELEGDPAVPGPGGPVGTKEGGKDTPNMPLNCLEAVSKPCFAS